MEDCGKRKLPPVAVCEKTAKRRELRLATVYGKSKSPSRLLGLPALQELALYALGAYTLAAHVQSTGKYKAVYSAVYLTIYLAFNSII